MKIDFANLKTDQVIEMAHNRTYGNIVGISLLLQESMRQYFQRMLADTSEESPLECNLIIDTTESQGLSEAEKPCIIGMYQDPNEGIVYFKFEGDEEHWYEIDYFTLDCQLDIIRAIETNDKILELWKNRKAN